MPTERPGGRGRTVRRGIPMIVATLALLWVACGPEPPRSRRDAPAALPGTAVGETLAEATEELRSHADSVEAALRPVPFLSGNERGALRRHLNENHLARARALGIDLGDARPDPAALERGGRLERLPDSATAWVIRELEFSLPLVTPDTRTLLEELGARFHGALDTLGLPPFRMELTSVLRTAETQRALRRENSNATSGQSAHEFGTTVDVAYTSFAAPLSPASSTVESVPTWLAPHIAAVARSVEGAVARRRSGEIRAILGRVVLEMQEEGKLLATMERQQAVFHLTLARPLAEPAASVAAP